VQHRSVHGARVRGDRRRLVRRRVLVDGTGARSGRADGALHLAAEDLELPPGAERPSWQDEFDSLEDELPRDESELWRIIERTHALFETLQQTRDCYGMVHFDLSGDSLVWSGLSPTAVDFDDCMWHWYAGDIARTIAYFRMTDGGELGPRGGVHGGL